MQEGKEEEERETEREREICYLEESCLPSLFLAFLGLLKREGEEWNSSQHLGNLSSTREMQMSILNHVCHRGEKRAIEDPCSREQHVESVIFVWQAIREKNGSCFLRLH